MTDHLHRSISSGKGSSGNMPQGDPQVCDSPTAEAINCPDRQPNLSLETQALQILDSSDDCIKVLDLDGRILFMSRGGQLLLGIQDITPFLNTSWVSFWQEADQPAASETIAKSRAGEVGTFQGYCPTMSGEPKWWECKVSPMRGADGQIEHLLCISRDITERKQAEAALRASEAEFRLFTTASSDTVYKMSADWREMRLLEGKNFLASTSHPNETWLGQYIPAGEQSRVMAAIAEAIRTKRTFELEHQVIQLDGTIGWTFSRAIPLLDPQGEIIEWLGAASDVTVRKRAELSAEFLATVTQNLAGATSVEDIIQTIGEQLHRYLQVSICAFVEIDEPAEVAVIDHSWHLEDVPSLVGNYHLPEFVTGEFLQTARLGQTIIVRDVVTDSRIADSERFASLKIGSFINVPLIRDNEWKFTLGVYHQTPYNWRDDEIHLMGELANRIWTKLERTRVEIALREREEQQAFLLKFNDALRAEPDADAVANRALQMLFEQMQLDRCFIGVYRLADDRGDFTHQVGNDRVPPVPDGVRLSDFPDALRVAINQTLVIDDLMETEGLTDTDRRNLGALGIRALVVATLREGENNPLWAIDAVSASPRRWTRGEIALLEEATERTWVAMERARTESALRESEAKYRSLFTSIDEGYNLLEMISDESGHPVDFRILETNPAWEQQTGLTDATGKTLLEVVPNFEQQWFDFYSDVVISGRGRRTEYYTASVDRWYTVYASRSGGAESRQLAVVFNDITERKQAEQQLRQVAERDAFRVKLSDALRPLTDASEVQATANRVLGEYLQTSRVTYFEVRGADYFVERDYVNGVESLQGGYSIESFGPELLATYRSGQTATSADVTADPQLSLEQRSAYAAIQIAAYIGVPLVKQGEFVAGLAVHSSTPRHWTSDEIALAEEVAERTWAAVERAHAEAALRESEERYRTLFESIDEGFCVIEVLFNENDKPIDYRFLEINPTFEQQTGLQQAIGKTARQLVPDLEDFWVETYGRVALTGEPVRLENTIASWDRWFDVYACRMGQPQEYKVALVFKDITERRQAEQQLRRVAERDAFRVKLSDALRSLADPVDIEETVTQAAMEYFGADRCYYTEIEDDNAIVRRDAAREGLPSVAGVYSLSNFALLQAALDAGQPFVVQDVHTTNAMDEDLRQLYIQLQVISYINVPVIKNGNPVGTLCLAQSTPRDWSDLEVELAVETADRTWAAVERARAETALRQSEERYRTLFESIDEGFCVVEVLFDTTGSPVDHRILQANPAFERQTGIANPEGKVASELAPGLEQYWNDLYGQVIRTGESIRIENRSDALNRWFDILVSRVGDAAMHRVAIVFSDISDRKRAEVALRQSEQRFRLMADAVPQIVWITDTEGRTEFFNKQWSDYTGVAYEPTTAAAVAASFVHPEDGDRTMAAFNEARRTGDIFSVEHRIRSAAGTYRWFLVRAEPYRDPQTGEIVRWFGASIDIHDRKLAEAAIAADLRDTQLLRDLSVRLTTEESIQALYQEIMATAIALTQADAGTVQILDETTQDLVLLATQGFEQSMIEHFYRINASSRLSCGIALRSGVRSFVDFDVPASEDPYGSMRLHVAAGYLCAQSTPLITRTGKTIGMVSTHWHTRHRPSDRELRFLDLLVRQAADLIEQRQAEAQRKQLLEREQAAREEAEQANRIKDEFLAVLSHELRSPLNPILGWSTLLLKGKLDAAKTTQALTIIQRNAKLQSELIEDLLDVSRILSGKLSLNVALVNLAATIRGAMETVRLAAEAKSITVEASLSPDVGLVLGDSTRLQQVIWNLLSNAVKFTPRGGQVNIQLERLDSEAQITVSDTGQGVAPEFLPYVFDYFRQADGATTRKFGGLGLGLAIVRHLVELHGGTVRADSLGEGQGATFTIRLPLMPTSSQASQDERSPQQSLDLSDIKILVVDDQTDTLDLVAFVLEQQGAQVIAATSAYEALLVLPQAKPDVLLSDIGMPEMDGYMLIQQVRALAPDQGGQIPAIALTAYAGDTNQQQVLAAGFQKHISKPIEPEVLVETIVHLIHPS